MQQSRRKEVIEVVGLIAIVGSLLFVGFQLRQDHQIAKSALTSEAIGIGTEINLRATDPEFGRILAKALDQSADLTVEEMIKIDGFLNTIKDLWLRECFLTYSGMYDECDGIIHEYSMRYFSNSFAQSWWELNGLPSDGSPFSVPAWVDDEIAGLGTDTKLRMLEEVKARID